MAVQGMSPSIHQAIIAELLKEKMLQQEQPTGAAAQVRPPIMPDLAAVFDQRDMAPQSKTTGDVMRGFMQEDLLGLDRERREADRRSDKLEADYYATATKRVADPKRKSTFDKNDWWKMLVGTALSYLASKNRGKGVSNFLKSYTGVKQGMAADFNEGEQQKYEKASREQAMDAQAALNMLSASDRTVRSLDSRYNRLNEQAYKAEQDAKSAVNKELAQLNVTVKSAVAAKDIDTVRNALNKINTLLGMEGSQHIDPYNRLLLDSWDKDLRKKAEEIETENSKQANFASMIQKRDADALKVKEETKKLGFEIDIKELDRDFKRDTYDSRVSQEASEAALDAAKVVTEKLRQGKLTADTAKSYAHKVYRAGRSLGRGGGELYAKASSGDRLALQTINSRVESLRKAIDSENLYVGLTEAEVNERLRKNRERYDEAVDLQTELANKLAAKAGATPKIKPSAGQGAKAGVKAGDPYAGLKVRKGKDGKPEFYR